MIIINQEEKKEINKTSNFEQNTNRKAISSLAGKIFPGPY
jgi:hypothetical protein